MNRLMSRPVMNITNPRCYYYGYNQMIEHIVYLLPLLTDYYLCPYAPTPLIQIPNFPNG